ncbi:hypothetical protein EMIHUDRAFT_228637 [Emiliania huxleyi CCMP1516]|uniref:U-box domain-containing protein n=2 Tax=Emiliania huxleyi TaxID=2903 RepID=A0A0D3KFC2_EMIH1|nr:hypothetical protein EMIHUDRAFT_228637 [Emiliania huxleyi CCMP1516]EOD34457.1 hypothetical protein EMIHUDRAFT_228637 [Emiliania huxleyi CCMP1516]|eukprot:XP_005786886.1 hypothetical protein EMIHUDRAFT_228637 [Emiliania huxleyi CCMP1516]
MSDPVMAADGHSYERSAIERWLATKSTSPMTGEALVHTFLAPNHMGLSELPRLGLER